MKPSCPNMPDIYISPPLIPVAVATPKLQYFYQVYVRNLFCYKKLFSIKKREDNFIIDTGLYKYKISFNTVAKDIVKILKALGYLDKGLFKLETSLERIILHTHYSVNMENLMKKIIENEHIVENIVTF